MKTQASLTTATIRAAATLVVASTALAQSPGSNGITELVSKDDLGQAPATDSYNASMSADGRYVAFASQIAYVPEDTNGEPDIYVADRMTGDIELVSSTSLGAVGNDESTRPHISADGRWVVFASVATDLMPLDTNGPAGDIFRKDTWTGDLIRVSNAHASLAASNGDSHSPTISDDGRYVAFVSGSTDLIPLDTNGFADIFVRDIQLGTTQRASDGVWGQSNGHATEPRISGSGTHVVYASSATNLVLFDTNGTRDVFLVELGFMPQLISRTEAGVPASGGSRSPYVSDDGSVVAYDSWAPDIIAGDTNGIVEDVFVYDAATGSNELVSVNNLGSQAASSVRAEDISGDGRVVAMSSRAPLAPFSSNFKHHFVRDLDLGKTYTASRPTGTTANLDDDIFNRASLSQDGSLVAFTTDATMGSLNPLGWAQVYVRSMQPDPIEYCSPSITSMGCQPRLFPSGFSSVTGASPFTLVGQNLPNDRNGLLFYGFAGASANPWGGGNMCVAGSKRRTPMTTTGGNPKPIDDCTGYFGFDMNGFASGDLGGKPAPELAIVGQQVNAQFWGRDAAAPSGVFLTTAVEYVVGP